MDLYTVTFSITAFILLITVMDVKTNRLVSEINKRETVTVCLCVFVASLCEFIGKETNGAAVGLIGVHRIAKLIEFCVTLCIGIAAAKAYGSVTKKKAVIGLLLSHAVFEVVAMFYGLIFRVDEQNKYHRERFYMVYVAVFFVTIIYCYVCIIRRNRQYQAKLGIVNILALVFLTFGISVQMIYSDITVDFVCVSIGAFFLYHYSGNVINQVDVTTGLLNRRCFERSLENMRSPAYVLLFDVDHFKKINDTLGHAEGDRCLYLVANKIFAVYGKDGSCYRIGGDEYCVILHKNLDRINSLNAKFSESVRTLRDSYGNIFGVSVGCAYYDKNKNDAKEVLKEADEKMYLAKKQNLDEADIA